MRLHRFIGDFNLNSGTLEIKDTGLVNQISKVLRLKSGEEIILGDGQNSEAIAEITDIKKGQISLKLLKKYQNQNESRKRVTLYAAILKRENFELVVQKATEAGVSEIVPVITERTIKTGLNIDRLKKIIREAAEQSGRGILPTISEPIKFKDAVIKGGILFDASGELMDQKMPSVENIFIGPEGDWNENEIKLAEENDLKIASLGKLTLRAETAAIVAAYLATQ